ncbi:DnaJ-domain-containing protein [Clathrospora elynae]|uniref:DnaJ-domain-containing protein n=1 Tax=Clathrospora elynae TaxID=706981 RepID=A0A6A5SFH7_9PLEO|nr:DnaJ-domain-containing protein [Clathrospora elynae]
MAPVKSNHDYYAVLEVRPSALRDEIKASYRRLALLHHPDKNFGCSYATAKTQLINVAWEALGDPVKRGEYDKTRPQPSASAGSRPEPSKPKPTSTAQPKRRPSPRPDTTAQDEARAKAQSNKNRQKWLDFEKIQEQSIRHCKKQVKPLQTDVAALNAKITTNREKLANDVPYKWNVFAFLTTRLSEQEKNELRSQSLNADAAIRIKRVPLDKVQAHLQRLESELVRRKEQEDMRLAAERDETARKECVAREKVEEEARRRVAQERARQHAAQEARDREAIKEAERIRQEHARQRAAQEVKNKAAREVAVRARQERIRKAEKMAEEEAKIEKERKKASRAGAQRYSTNGCSHMHKVWWEQVQGRYDCAHCKRLLYTFGYQCPVCATIACASCMHQLKSGRTPAVDNSHRDERRGHDHSARGSGRSTGGYDYNHTPSYDSYPPPPSPPSYSNPHEYDGYWD